MLGESRHLHQMVDVLQSKHKQYADEIQACIDSHSVDQLQIKRIAGIYFFWFYSMGGIIRLFSAILFPPSLSEYLYDSVLSIICYYVLKESWKKAWVNWKKVEEN